MSAVSKFPKEQTGIERSVLLILLSRQGCAAGDLPTLQPRMSMKRIHTKKKPMVLQDMLRIQIFIYTMHPPVQYYL